jgi:hypothetical protein
VDEEQWVAENAARISQALTRQRVQVELAALLGGDDGGRRRERRLEAARRELTGLQLTWTLEEEPWNST